MGMEQPGCNCQRVECLGLQMELGTESLIVLFFVWSHVWSSGVREFWTCIAVLPGGCFRFLIILLMKSKIKSIMKHIRSWSPGSDPPQRLRREIHFPWLAPCSEAHIFHNSNQTTVSTCQSSIITWEAWSNENWAINTSQNLDLVTTTSYPVVLHISEQVKNNPG